MAKYVKTEEGYKETTELLDGKMDKYNPVGFGSFSMGRKASSVVGTNSHAEGYYITASGNYSHAEGDTTTASGEASHAEGFSTTASGGSSHAEGFSTNKFSTVVTATNPTNADIITAWKSRKFSVAKGDSSHVEGQDSLALGNYSHAEGSRTTASSNYSHAEGSSTTASGSNSHAEGYKTTASGTQSHAEGGSTTASGSNSHAEGNTTTASGSNSHAEGYKTTASGTSSHAEGFFTKASGVYQHAQGKYNIEDSAGTYADIIGNGTSSKRSNAATVDWSGNAWYAGDVYVGSTSGTNKDAGSKKLATEEYASGLGITNAAVGQIARITAVDSDGKPTAWEPVDMASGDGYIKPDSGIPKSDLSNEVQDSLSKADTALQEHQDISGKVDKVEGKGLSTEDYTTEEKSKLNGINIDEIKSDITDLQTALIGVSDLIGGDV